MSRVVPAPLARPLSAPDHRPAVRSAPVLISPFPARRAAPRDAAGAPRAHKPTVRRQPAIRQSHHPDGISRDELKDARPEPTRSYRRCGHTTCASPKPGDNHLTGEVRPQLLPSGTDGSVLRSQPVIALVVLVER